MNASGTALQEKHTAEASALYMAFELGALLDCIAKAKARCGLAPEASVHSCYEAGRDGFWLHR